MARDPAVTLGSPIDCSHATDVPIHEDGRVVGYICRCGARFDAALMTLFSATVASPYRPQPITREELSARRSSPRGGRHG